MASRLNHYTTPSCNIPGHPDYPDYMSPNEPQTEPFCNIADHPLGRCNIDSHPNYPHLMGRFRKLHLVTYPYDNFSQKLAQFQSVNNSRFVGEPFFLQLVV